MPEAIPRRIGRYDVITLLGEGGMARAYLAVSRGPGRFNKLAVIKQILPELSQDPSFVAMFLDEARLAARLHHPNIVQTFDVAEHEGNYLLAMEYLDGLPLTSVYRRIHPKLLPLETHLWVLTQVLTGLHYAHTLCDYDGSPLGVVHRDISPANVLVTYAGDVKILDFGVAKARGALAVGTESRIKGKPAYCAPEQLRGMEPDPRADVFAVGVMLWEVLAGKRLNRHPTLVEAAKARLSGREPRIREVSPAVDPDLAEICDRATTMDPRDRYTTAAEFRIELQAHLAKLRNDGRRALVERLEEVFSVERMELRRLIERRLADQTPSPIPTASTLLPPTPASTLAATPASTAAATPVPRPYRLARVAGLAAVGVACVALTMVWVLRKRPQPEQPAPAASSTAAVRAAPSGTPEMPAKTQAATLPSGVVPPPPQPAAVEIPAKEAPAPPAASAGGAPEARPAVGSSVAETRPSNGARPLRPKAGAAGVAKRSAAQRPTAVAPQAPENPAGSGAASKQSSPVPAAAPGTHLVRPPRTLHGTVDERDPYSP